MEQEVLPYSSDDYTGSIKKLAVDNRSNCWIYGPAFIAICIAFRLCRKQD